MEIVKTEDGKYTVDNGKGKDKIAIKYVFATKKDAQKFLETHRG